MTIERIERGDWNCDILYGYGRILRARDIFVRNVPDGVRRAQIANPDLTANELRTKATPEEIVQGESAASIEIAKLVLSRATDWDKSKLTVDEYVETQLPSDVGEEIVRRLSVAVASLDTQDPKKNNV